MFYDDAILLYIYFLLRKFMSKSYCQALCFLKVGYLIIPSVHQKEKAWNEGYNFGHLNAEMKKEIMRYNTLMFHDSIRLQKVLPSPDNGQGTLSQKYMCMHRICISSTCLGF